MNEPSPQDKLIRLADVVTMAQTIDDDAPAKAQMRVVSKTEYARVQGHRAAVGIQVIGLSLFAVICLVVTIGLMAACLACLIAAQPVLALACLSFSLVFGLVTFSFYAAASKCAEKRSDRDVMPLTRANAAHLPAADSLVRASAPPVQEPERVLLRPAAKTLEPAVLLRPATEGQEVQSEQLLRPSS